MCRYSSTWDMATIRDKVGHLEILPDRPSQRTSRSSARRRPHPRSTARMARSRLPVRVCGSGACSRSLAWSFISQFPTRVPCRSTPGTRSIAAAVAGSSIWLSAISRASFRIGESRRLMVEEDRRFARSADRYCCASALVNPGPAPKTRIQAKNASRPVR